MQSSSRDMVLQQVVCTFDTVCPIPVGMTAATWTTGYVSAALDRVKWHQHVVE